MHTKKFNVILLRNAYSIRKFHIKNFARMSAAYTNGTYVLNLSHLWCRVLSECTEKCLYFISASSLIQQAFEGEYPKLLRLYNNLWNKVKPFKAALEVCKRKTMFLHYINASNPENLLFRLVTKI